MDALFDLEALETYQVGIHGSGGIKVGPTVRSYVRAFEARFLNANAEAST